MIILFDIFANILLSGNILSRRKLLKEFKKTNVPDHNVQKTLVSYNLFFMNFVCISRTNNLMFLHLIDFRHLNVRTLHTQSLRMIKKNVDFEEQQKQNKLQYRVRSTPCFYSISS